MLAARMERSRTWWQSWCVDRDVATDRRVAMDTWYCLGVILVVVEIVSRL